MHIQKDLFKSTGVMSDVQCSMESGYEYHSKASLWHQNNLMSVLMGCTLGNSATHVVSRAEAVLGGVSAKVHHLVEAEFATVD